MDASADRPTPDTTSTPPEVVVYWRPGCGFCARLRRSLAKAGVPTREVDIWDDPDAAAIVRGAADGNETVPTVAVGGELLVNPRPSVVVDLAERAGVAVTPPEDGGGLLSRLRRP